MDGHSDPIRVGLVGFGFAGRVFHAPLISAEPRLKLLAVASSDPERVLHSVPMVRVAPNPADLIVADDLDLIVLATPNDTHAPLARAAIDSGKHVVVDKPFTTTLREARELVSCAEKNGRIVSVFQNRRWDSDYLTVRDVIEAGHVGEVTYFESRIDRFRPVVRNRWRERPGNGTGVWYDLGPHLVDQALCLFGLPDRINASLANQRDGAQSVDWAHVVLEYGSRRVILHASMLAAGGTNRFVIQGDQGSLVKRRPDQQEAQLLAGMFPGAAGWGEDDDDLILFAPDGTSSNLPAVRGDQREFYAGLAAALQGKGRAPVTAMQAVGVMAVIIAAEEASREGVAKRLDLNEAEWQAWDERPALRRHGEAAEA